jgi:hypothetical protein
MQRLIISYELQCIFVTIIEQVDDILLKKYFLFLLFINRYFTS